MDSDPTGFRRLNFSRLLLLYTRKFESSNPCQAVNYYFFLRELPQSDGEENDEGNNSLFVQCLTELVIQTGEYDLLLGVLPGASEQADGQERRPGAIDRFGSAGAELAPTNLVAHVAKSLEARGQLAEAVGVYRLAGGVRNLLPAVRLVNLLLVPVIAISEDHQQGINQGDRQALLHLAADVSDHFVLHPFCLCFYKPVNCIPFKVGHSTRRLDPIISTAGASTGVNSTSSSAMLSALQSAAQTLYYLLDLATFFDLGVGAGQWQAALDHMDRIGLFPTAATGDEVDAKVAAFAALPDLVRRPLPAALLLLMRCIAAKATSAAVSNTRG